MNLSTARSAARAKEVGIRKVVGSEKNTDQSIPDRIYFNHCTFNGTGNWHCLDLLIMVQ
jgi:hypothetical protein